MRRSFDGYGEMNARKELEKNRPALRSLRVLLLALMVVAVSLPRPAPASGPFVYETAFFDERNFDDLMAGHLGDSFGRMSLAPLISYLHLTGRLTPRHAELFRSHRKQRRGEQYLSVWRTRTDFANLLAAQGHPGLDFERWKTITRTNTKDGQVLVTQYNINNCLADAFRVAGNTLENRRSRYGSASPKLKRWIEAQIKVFNHCGNEAFDPPSDPQEDWGTLERQDRQYQVAASYFYGGRYLEAARRFREIGNSSSPWSGLSQYLVGRSLAREATVDETNRQMYLHQALTEFRLLAEDRRYVASFPWILGQFRRMEAELYPNLVLSRIERGIVQDPETVPFEDISDYVYLESSNYYKRRGDSDYADWRFLAGTLNPRGATLNPHWVAEIIGRWRDKKSLEWLFLALIAADSNAGDKTLRELLDAARKLGPETPGYYVMLEHRVRITALLGDVSGALALASNPHEGKKPLSKGHINRVRLRAANISTSWDDYFRFASMLPLQLPWTDRYVRSLSAERFNHITRTTKLFPGDTTALINNFFTPQMMLKTISRESLSDYQRGRLAISGWTKAILMDNLDAARKLSGQAKRYLPRLKNAFERFETGRNPQLEAALIVLDNPAFSPYMWPGAGRVQHRTQPGRPAPDYIALPWNRNNWWCPGANDNSGGRDWFPSGPRFDPYDEGQREEILRMQKAGHVSAADFFGPIVLSYARSNLDDLRVPRALHRVVFANRYECMAAPAKIGREAHNLLHEHFPDSEWAEKTPYWHE